MEKTPTCEAKERSAAQEFCRLLGNTQVNVRADMNPTRDS